MDGTNRIDELEKKFIENPRRYFAPLANEYRKAGNPHQAIAICRAHLAQLPGHMSGQIVYGQALFEGGDYDQAQTVFENALAMDRENLVALRHLGDLALRKGETAAARQWYSKVLEIDPKDATVIGLVNEIDAAAEAQTSTTDAEPASTTTPEAVQPMPEPAVEPDPLHNEEEDRLIAEELGYPVPPAHAFVTETMAELYLAQGFRDRAISVYRQLVSIRPEDDRLRNRLAELEQPTAEASAIPVEDTQSEPELIEARREELPSVESPEVPQEDDRAPSIEAPTPSPEIQSPSEESGAGQVPAVDSPPTEIPEAEPESVETVVSDEPRAEPEGFETTSYAPPAETTSYAPTAETTSYAPTAEPTSYSAANDFEAAATAGASEIEPVPAARGLTVREFFASLGKVKPAERSNGTSSNGAAHEAPGWSAASGDADEKAAAALAGAFGGSQGGAPFTPAPSSPVTGKESEEDVARFRAWLDGLTT